MLVADHLGLHHTAFRCLDILVEVTPELGRMGEQLHG